MGRCSDAKERLVATAAQLIRERGYTAVSVADICDAAGLKKGSFYHFYASKLDLVLDAIDEYAKGYAELILLSLRPGATATARLQGVFSALRGSVQARCASEGVARGCPMGNLALEMADREDAIRRKIASVFDALRGALEGIVESGIRSGEFPAQDARRTAESIVATIQGAMVLTKTANDPAVFDRVLSGALSNVAPQATFASV